METNNLNLSYRQCEMAMLMVMIGKLKDVAVTDVSKRIGVGRKNPQFFNLMKSLENAGVVREVKREGSFRFIDIDIKSLKRILWITPRLDIIRRYYEEVHYLFE